MQCVRMCLHPARHLINALPAPLQYDVVFMSMNEPYRLVLSEVCMWLGAALLLLRGTLLRHGPCLRPCFSCLGSRYPRLGPEHAVLKLELMMLPSLLPPLFAACTCTPV